MTLPVLQFTGVVYRAHHPRWAFDPLSGEGAKLHGGRFNRQGTRTLYTSLVSITALKEAQQGFPFKLQEPVTLVAYQVDCKDIVDLHNPGVMKALGYSSNDLACAWEDLADQKQVPPTWLLVDELRKLNIAGILVRSFASGCTEKNLNLILWEWSDIPPYSIQIIDNLGRLPKSQDSWGSEH